MIGAYFEIAIMLIVAFLLGMFVAWQYWRKKYKDLDERAAKDRASSSKKIEELEEKLRKSEAELTEKDNELEKAEKKTKKSEKDVAKLEKEVSKSNKEVENLEKENEKLKKENKALSEDLEDATSQLEKDNKTPKKSSYYKYIDGNRYKAITLAAAEEAISGKGDGRISKDDAKTIFDTISDGKQYTPVEKATIKYIRDNYKWTDEADQLFRHMVGSWAAQDHDPDKVK